jgi:hypothetical protein
MNKHTPSPWFASNAYGNGSAIWIAPTEGAKMVLQGANCLRSDSVKYEEISIEQLQANAKLIAAAPDLLAALEAMTYYFAEYEKDDSAKYGFKAARAAIAKATA